TILRNTAERVGFFATENPNRRSSGILTQTPWRLRRFGARRQPPRQRTSWTSRLLLVVHGCRVDLLAVCVGDGRRYGPALAVGGDDNLAGNCELGVLLL